jgi:hypothetical protein
VQSPPEPFKASSAPLRAETAAGFAGTRARDDLLRNPGGLAAISTKLFYLL